MPKKLKNSELNRISIDEFKKCKKNPIVIILDNIRSLHNVGAIFRTADAFLIEKIYLCGITAKPPHKEIHKTALGATDSVDWEYCSTTLEAIEKLKGYSIFSVEQTQSSVMLDEFEIDKNVKYGIVFGNEVKGVGQHIIDKSKGCIEIPQYGTKHSLNISVSLGIVVWDLCGKF